MHLNIYKKYKKFGVSTSNERELMNQLTLKRSSDRRV